MMLPQFVPAPPRKESAVSDTKMTDAHCKDIGGDDGLCYANFARDLERALNECVEALENQNGSLAAMARIHNALAHVAKLREKYRG